jgi:putative FmdB family regulatory protein
MPKKMSKYMLFDFRCDQHGKFEDFVKPDVYYAKCPECKRPCDRLISTPTLGLSGTDPSLPTAYDKWEKRNKAKTAEDKKFYKEHGVDKKHHSYGS